MPSAIIHNETKTEWRAMRVLSFTTVFPNAAAPLHGLFMPERLRFCTPPHQVRVVAPLAFPPWYRMQPFPDRDERAGLRVSHPNFYYVPRFGKWLDGLALFASSFSAVRKLHNEFRFELIDVHFGYPDGFAAVLLGQYFNVPVVTTLHGNETLLAETSALRRRAIAYALRKSSAVAAVSEPLGRFAQQILAQAPGPAPVVRVIGNGVDLTRFSPSHPSLARRALGLAHEGPLIVSVGHLSPRKGFQRILAAMPNLLQRVPGLMLAVVGGPSAERSNEAELRSLAQRLGLEEHVVFAGAAEPDRVAQWMRAADLFVLASDQEGNPCVVWEALACGLPVVATRVGELARILPDFAGLLVDDPDDLHGLGEAIAAGLSRPFDRVAIRAWAERHGWERIAAKVGETWEEAAAVYRASRPVHRPAPRVSFGG
jgi:teichuronic acid biosynthesis glycosyltransferase TuaC